MALCIASAILASTLLHRHIEETADMVTSTDQTNTQPTDSTMTRSDLPNASIRISIDRGGTFTDVHASWPDPYNPTGSRKETITKLLSQDPSNYKDAPTEGIRRILEHVTGDSLPRGEPLPTNKIGESI